MLWNWLRCTLMHWNAQKYNKMHYNALRCTKIHYDTLRWSRVHKDDLRCTKMLLHHNLYHMSLWTAPSMGMYLKYCISQESRGGKYSLCHIKQHQHAVYTQNCSCIKLYWTSHFSENLSKSASIVNSSVSILPIHHFLYSY